MFEEEIKYIKELIINQETLKEYGDFDLEYVDYIIIKKELNFYIDNLVVNNFYINQNTNDEEYRLYIFKIISNNKIIGFIFPLTTLNLNGKINMRLTYAQWNRNKFSVKKGNVLNSLMNKNPRDKYLFLLRISTAENILSKIEDTKISFDWPYNKEFGVVLDHSEFYYYSNWLGVQWKEIYDKYNTVYYFTIEERRN